ncbi:TetR/AcrR family transcriptional regulator [Lactococcus muris]|uniref:TetR/AcrR family transcriptional regulator n=1 Tax=Lactococcus muris TaxID=2941330 RepID=UPI00373FCFE9
MGLGTRENIINSFFRLALQEPNKQHFTLSEIAREANVSRQAIYKKHYKNTEEILEDIRNKMNLEIFKRLDSAVMKEEESPFTFFAKEILPIVYKYRIWFRVLTTTSMDSYYGRIVETRLSTYFLPFLDENDSRKKMHVSEEFKVRIISKNIISIVTAWLNQDFPEPPEAFSKTFLELLTASSNDLLKDEHRL